jgi:GT2 family glycosyltransferase
MVNFVTGCLMLVRRQVFAKIGLLDEAFFLYFEDVEFCLRAHRHGIAMLYFPEAVIWHKVGAGGRGRYLPHYLYYQTRNRYLVLRKEGTWLYRIWLVLLQIFLYGLLRAGMVAISPGKEKWPRIRAISQGCWDGLRGRAGPKPEAYEIPNFKR